MAQSLYRKYRPQTFDEVAGQETIERTLRNAVSDKTFAHAYLFCGPRGTGKTTTARLFAKALLCEKGPTPDPDGTCEECKEIADGVHPDVYELDAASRTGVDAVREEIIGRVQYAPTRGEYKVYIIDEVHMLSTQAFNALLKTLEEPPSHVVFIMCTTHPHKVPETIQSRCQRFDFHRLSEHDIIDTLKVIAAGEKFQIDREALGAIARHATGGMRDAITMLEQLAAFTGGTITPDDVEELIGSADASTIFRVSEAIAKRDVATCFACADDLAEEGADIAQFTKELTAHMRDLFVFTLTGDVPAEIDPGSATKMKALAKAYGDSDRLMRVLEILGDLSRELRDSTDPRLRLEIAFTRLSRPQSDLTLEALSERIDALEAGMPLSTGSSAMPKPSAAVSSQNTAAPVQNPPAPAQAVVRESVSTQDAAASQGVETPAKPAGGAPLSSAPTPTPEEAEERKTQAIPQTFAGELTDASARRAWADVVAEIKRVKPARAVMFRGTAARVEDDGTFVIVFPANQAFVAKQVNSKPETKELIEASLTKVLGRKVPFMCEIGEEGAPVSPVTEPDAVPDSVYEQAAPAQESEGADRAPKQEQAASAPNGDEGEQVASEGGASSKPAVVPVAKPPSADSESPANEYEAGSLEAMLSAGFGGKVDVEEVPAAPDDTSTQAPTQE